jgi:hypothetical protein
MEKKKADIKRKPRCGMLENVGMVRKVKLL